MRDINPVIALWLESTEASTPNERIICYHPESDSYLMKPRVCSKYMYGCAHRDVNVSLIPFGVHVDSISNIVCSINTQY